MAREARQAHGQKQSLFEERDIELRNAKSQNRGCIKMMVDAVQQVGQPAMDLEFTNSIELN